MNPSANTVDLRPSTSSKDALSAGRCKINSALWGDENDPG